MHIEHNTYTVHTVHRAVDCSVQKDGMGLLEYQAMRSLRPVHHIQNHTCPVTLLQPARRAAVLDQPSSLRPHWFSLSIGKISAMWLRTGIEPLFFDVVSERVEWMNPEQYLDRLKKSWNASLSSSREWNLFVPSHRFYSSFAALGIYIVYWNKMYV